MTETVTVFGIFEDTKKAEEALYELKGAGFRGDQVGFAARRLRSTQTEARERVGVLAGDLIAGLLAATETLFLPLIGPADLPSVLESNLLVAERVEEVIEGSRAKEEASPAAQTPGEPHTAEEAAAEVDRAADAEQEPKESVVEADAAAGSLVGSFVGAVAALLIPGIGPVVAGGILLTPLVSAAVGAVVGDVIGGLVAVGLPADAAQRYAREFEAGRTIVSVRADDPHQSQKAQDILLRLGARDIRAQR